MKTRSSTKYSKKINKNIKNVRYLVQKINDKWVNMFSNYQISMDKQVFRLFGSVRSTPDYCHFDCCHCPKPEACGIFFAFGTFRNQCAGCKRRGGRHMNMIFFSSDMIAKKQRRQLMRCARSGVHAGCCRARSCRKLANLTRDQGLRCTGCRRSREN